MHRNIFLKRKILVVVWYLSIKNILKVQLFSLLSIKLALLRFNLDKNPIIIQDGHLNKKKKKNEATADLFTSFLHIALKNYNQIKIRCGLCI